MMKRKFSEMLLAIGFKVRFRNRFVKQLGDGLEFRETNRMRLKLTFLMNMSHPNKEEKAK